MKVHERFICAFCLLFLEFILIGAQILFPNEDICSFETESNGPLPPSVPESFILKSELADRENARLFWEEVYFDSLNVRAKYKTVYQGIETHYIFDYDEEQIIQYQVFHPGVSAEDDPESLESCSVTSMETNPMHRIFGYRYEHLDTKRSRMYNSFEVLQFGGNYKYAFNATKKIDDRGILSDIYHGCLFIPQFKSTLDKTFYWNNKIVIPASGVDQIPVKIDTYGEIFIPNGTGYSEKIEVWLIESIPWFQGNPEFDESTFQVPRKMYCKDDRAVKNLPNLPKRFSGRLEETTIKRDMDGNLQDLGIEQFSEIWYDSVSNMARVDYVLSLEDEEIFIEMGPISVTGVFDMSEGVAYYTNKLTGECIPFAINPDFFLVSKDSDRKLAPPNEVFGIDANNLEYKGKNVARNVLCNVWAGQISESNGNGSKDFVEVYFATNGWHSDSEEDEEYDFPVRITMIDFSNEDGERFEIVSEANIFKYKATEPSPSVYDISGCLSAQNQNYYFFSVQKTAKELSSYDREKFLRATRLAIKDYSKIGSLLRVQNVDIYVPSAMKNVIISFSLMDTPLLHGKDKKEPGTSLILAEANLKRAIDNGDFSIAVNFVPGKEEEYIHSLPGSLIQVTPQADTNIESIIYLHAFGEGNEKKDDKKEGYSMNMRTEEGTTYSYILDERKDMLQFPDIMYAEKKKDEPEGYSSGSLGGLAVGMLILGIILGIGLMYSYLKKYGDQSVGSHIMLDERK